MLSYTLQDANDAPDTILYLHGLGVAGWSWDPVIAATPNHAALVVDLPGHGKSSHIPWQSLADTAEKVAEVVDDFPTDRPLHLAGHSLGAYVGLILLTLRQDRFETAVLSGFHLSAPGHPILLKLAYVANGLVFRSPRLLRRFASVFGDEATQARFIEGAKVIASRTIRRAGIQVVDFKPPAQLGMLTLPIMAISGQAEPDAIRSAPVQLAHHLPAVDPHVLSDRDHMWPIKEPQTFADMQSAHIAANA